jgi:NAD-dependent SIR2 family protein deacetylase
MHYTTIKIWASGFVMASGLLFNMMIFCTKSMNWLWKDSMFSVAYFDDQISFAITFRNTIPEEFVQEFHHMFTSKKIGDTTVLQYMYGKQFQVQEFPCLPTQENADKTVSIYDPRYHVHVPLMQENNKSQSITVAELCEIVRTKSVAWYTGAGISAPVVPTMAALESSLGFSGDTYHERAANLVCTALRNPEHIVAAMHWFYGQCLQGKPTPAHKAVAEYMQGSNRCQLFTENLDMLHEHSGIVPMRVGDPLVFKTVVTSDLLQKTDVFVCIGLSHDDRGLLGYYKHHNPQGIIVALDLERPAYIGKSDYFLHGDAQELLPELVKNLANKKSYY